MSYALGIFVMIFVIVGTLSLLNLTQKDVADAISVFNTSTGTDDIQAQRPEIPQAHNEAITRLITAINQALKTDHTNCLLNYQQLPELGEGGTSFVFTENTPRKGETSLQILGGAGGKQLVETRTIRSLDLCVIENDDGLLVPRDVSQVQITYQNGNIIIANPQDNLVAEEFNDGGWLYKDSRGKVCFFPSSGYGFDEDVLSDKQDTNYLGYQIGRVTQKTQVAGTTPLFEWCSTPDGSDFFHYNSIELRGEYQGLQTPSKHVISQHCQGDIGVDCPALAESCTPDFQQLAGSSCTILASEKDTFSFDGCLAFTATTGTILPAFQPEGIGNSFQEDMALAFPGNDDEVVKLFSETEWFGFQNEALLCTNQQWIACNYYAAGKSINGYTCTQTQNTYMWQKSN